ncbi:MAG: dephospho-CoA kinase, partial [Firmicutes bacterium]|nr:dephospho-CoA kinase [Bacillota bacterium]
VKKRSGLSEEQILARMAKQMPQEEKERRADLVIVNDGDMNALRKAVYEAAAPLLGI